MSRPLGTGYRHFLYACSQAEAPAIVELNMSQGYILRRAIDGGPLSDGMGCYPVFACGNWGGLAHDLQQKNVKGLVSLSLVTDPFGDYTPELLRSCFPDKMFEFKRHCVIDLEQDWQSAVSPAHRRNIVKAERVCEVQRCDGPARYLDEWVDLYECLVRRHNIRGIAAFSRKSFQQQFAVPGLEVFRASVDGKVAGMLVWYVDGENAYYHLAAYNEVGYVNRVSFALFNQALRHFAGLGLRFLGLGAGAGVKGDAEDGLSRFKRGWSHTTRTVYFCGRIFDRMRYGDLVRQRNVVETNYFPAYRAGEFR